MVPIKVERLIYAVDSHTAGEPTRVVLGGMPHIPGTTMVEKLDYVNRHEQRLRASVLHEPRGHRDMFGALITAPCDSQADAGIIFMHGSSFLSMCGHGTIGATTVLLETGYIQKREPVTAITWDTPSGLVQAEAAIENGSIKHISFRNVPSFLYRSEVPLRLDCGAEIMLDIAFGGNFFAIVSAESLGLRVSLDEAEDIKRLGLEILDKVNRQVEVSHPLHPHINKVELVEIYEEAQTAGINAKNAVIFGDGQIDRSPCGTGTSAKVATLYAKGKLGLGEDYYYQSITGTVFKGQAVSTAQIGEYQGIVPEISGSAYITGFQLLMLDSDDPLKYGFVV